jgi:hypothetical protein
MNIKTIAILLLCIISTPSLSQENKNGIGIRFGGLNSGITFRHFTNSSTAIEGILNPGHRGFIITGLYQKHLAIENAPGLNWFIGGGAHIGLFRNGGSYYVYKRKGNVVFIEEEGGANAVGGLDFIIGLNYKIKGAPFDISIDAKPFIDLFRYSSGYFDGGLSFRFEF